MKIETKYNVGDEVWFIHDHMVMKGVIERIHIYIWGGEPQVWCEIKPALRPVTEVGEVWEGFIYPPPKKNC